MDAANLASDQIMAIGQYRKARVLQSRDNRIAIFTTPDAPAQVMDITERTRTHFVLADGSKLKFRPVGTSCGWPLARCHITTEQLAARWV